MGSDSMKPEPPDVSGDPVAERIMKYKPKERAPPDYNRMVESIPGGFIITKRVEKPDVTEKAKV